MMSSDTTSFSFAGLAYVMLASVMTLILVRPLRRRVLLPLMLSLVSSTAESVAAFRIVLSCILASTNKQQQNEARSQSTSEAGSTSSTSSSLKSLIASCRQDRFGTVCGDDFLAKRFVSGPVSFLCNRFPQFVLSIVQPRAAGGVEGVWSRTFVIDSLVVHFISTSGSPTSSSVAEPCPSISQFLIVGAGFDTRAYRFRSLLTSHQVTTFEFDLPHTQKRKQASLANVAGYIRTFAPANTTNDTIKGTKNEQTTKWVHYVPLDLLSSVSALRSTAVAAGVKPQCRSLLLCEGVLTYFTVEAVQQTFLFFNSVCAVNSILVFTYQSNKNFEEEEEAMQSGDKARIQRALDRRDMRLRAANLGEPTKFYPPPALMQQIVEKAGWQLVEVWDSTALEQIMLQRLPKTVSGLTAIVKGMTVAVAIKVRDQQQLSA